MASVKLENKSARILHIGLGGAESIAVPPTEGGITVTFASDSEQARFDAAVATPAVQEWVEAGELVIESADPPEPPELPEADDDDADEDDR